MSTNADQTSTDVATDARAVATVEQLEQEGDVAADYLEGLLDIADIDGDLTLDVRAGRAYVSVENDDQDALRLLSDPDTVQALQELTRIAVQTQTGRFSRLILDVGGSRDARQRPGAHQRRAQLGEVSLRQVRIGPVEVVGDGESQHRVAQELQAFVVLHPGVLEGVGAVG